MSVNFFNEKKSQWIEEFNITVKIYSVYLQVKILSVFTVKILTPASTLQMYFIADFCPLINHKMNLI